VEQLLTTLTGRKLVKRTELSEAMQALRDAAEDIEIADLDAPSVV
jgi:hypothetical protein